MSSVTRLLPGVLLAGMLVLGGCGKQDEQPTRFNQTLGDSPVGAPVATGLIDTGVLQDPTAYKPAPYERLEGGPAGGGAGGPEAEAAQAVLKEFILALFALDIDTILDTHVPEQVAVLREDEYMSSFYEAKDTLVTFWAVFKDKATGPEFEPFVRVIELLPELAEPVANAMTVSVLDEENAVATFDLERFELPEDVQAELMAASQQIMTLAMGAMMAQMGAAGLTGGPTPGGTPPEEPNAPAETPATPEIPGIPGMPAGGFSPEMFQQFMPSDADTQQNCPLRKIDGEWRLVLPFSVQEEQAEVISEGLVLVKDLLADMTTRIDQTDTLDLGAFTQIAAETGTRMAPAFEGWWARAQMMIASITEEPTDDTGAEEEEEAAEPNEPEDPNADSAPTPGRRRPRP